ncbi:MAG TPA: type VI secretion system accessory protein TagJ [Gemmataceae bacterium]|nr:type VI secretion system accessory protein TagJ [Gemmataceae bacterium]
MDASDLFRAGKLQDAVRAQTQAVKADPADPNKRVFLFELLAFAGDLDRAGKQIAAVRYDEPTRDATVTLYRLLLEAEAARRRFFRDGEPPTFLGEPPEHLLLRLEAAALRRQGQAREALAVLGRARAVTPSTPVELNGKAYPSLRDTDDLFGPVLEVLSAGNYAWVPLEQVNMLLSPGPKYPRDLIWLPARLVTRNGENGEVFLSVLYPGSWDDADERVRLGHVTDWAGGGEEPVRAVGARVFQAGDEEVCLVDWRQLRVP